MALLDTNGLSTYQLRALECVLARSPKETWQQVADRAGVSLRTLHRYLADDAFMDALHERFRNEVGAERTRVLRALTRKAVRGDVAAQRLFFQLSGDLTEQVAIEHGGSVEVIDGPSRVPPAMRGELLAVITGRVELSDDVWSEVHRLLNGREVRTVDMPAPRPMKLISASNDEEVAL